MHSELTLREYKYAKTKADIWEAFLQLLYVNDFEAISVNEICKNAHVSKGTFFNYFPSKEHLYTYYGWCFCADLFVFLNQDDKKQLTSIEKIKLIFRFTVLEDEKIMNLFPKFVSHILRRSLNIINEVRFTKADFIYRYPEHKHLFQGKEDILLPTVGDHFFKLVEEGIEKEELQNDISVEGTVFKILAIYFSPPIISKFLRKDYSLENVYEKTLDDLLNTIVSK